MAYNLERRKYTIDMEESNLKPTNPATPFHCLSIENIFYNIAGRSPSLFITDLFATWPEQNG
jgi:hypothetical protein